MRVEVGEMQRLDRQKDLVEVLEVEEGQQVEGDAKGQQMLAAGGVLRRDTDGAGDDVVDQDGAKQEKDVQHVPFGIKNDRHHGQPGDDRAAAIAPEQMEAQHSDGQEDKEEREGVEEHRNSW